MNFKVGTINQGTCFKNFIAVSPDKIKRTILNCIIHNYNSWG